MKKLIVPLFAAILALNYSCNRQPSDHMETGNETVFIHTVFFWLNDHVTEDEKKQFESGLEKLGTVSSIYKFWYGKPAGTPREVVDNSYDYAWIVHFSSAEAQDKYQEDPVHLEFVEKYSHLWQEVKVYDTLLK